MTQGPCMQQAARRAGCTAVPTTPGPTETRGPTAHDERGPTALNSSGNTGGEDKPDARSRRDVSFMALYLGFIMQVCCDDQGPKDAP